LNKEINLNIAYAKSRSSVNKIETKRKTSKNPEILEDFRFVSTSVT